jgi:hypothetical protein
MNRQQDNRTGILAGVSDTLVMLWKQRDAALAYEKKHNIEPRTSKRYLEAQREVDNYFLPPKQKAMRNKPKKKVYMPDDGWAY